MIRGRILGTILMLGEALTRVSRQYREIAAAQAGEQTLFAVGVWMRGITSAEIDKVRATLDEPDALREGGWWDAQVCRRRTLFMALAVEASSPERASLRCMEELTRRFELQGVSTAEAVRIEVEQMPEEFRKEVHHA